MTRAEYDALRTAYFHLCGQSDYSRALGRQQVHRLLLCAEREHAIEDAANDHAEADAHPVNINQQAAE